MGINLETPPSPSVPFAATYYLGTADEKFAKKLSVADRQNVGGLTIYITEQLRARKFPVKVTRPDGKPVEDANVWLAEIRNPTEVVGGAVSHTVADGTFDLTGFEGIDYFLHADIYAKPLSEPTIEAIEAESEPSGLPARKTSTPLLLRWLRLGNSLSIPPICQLDQIDVLTHQTSPQVHSYFRSHLSPCGVRLWSPVQRHVYFLWYGQRLSSIASPNGEHSIPRVVSKKSVTFIGICNPSAC